MEEEGRDHFYFQDDLGSPMRLTDEAGRSEEAYGFDEFGNDIWTAKDIFQDSMQSFGFTGYQMDSAGGLYFAQARRYDSGIGRFVSEDIMRGHIAVPFTMNHYSYCWNRPMDLVDLNGKFPSWRDLKKFWNKYIYGEETIGSSTNTVVTGKNWGMGTYHSEVYDITKTSDKYTGSWIKNVTTLGNDGNSQSYSLNIPSADLGKGNKFGIPTSLGVTFSNGGVSLDANIGIDLGKLNVNIPISIGLNWDNLVSVDASLNGAWQMIFGVNTLPAYRKHGYAGELINAAIADAKLQGRKGLVLTCKEKLLHYYAKFGFVNEGISASTHGNVVWYQIILT